MIKDEPIWRRIILDLSAVFFLIGGVVNLIYFISLIPISSIYPFKIIANVSFYHLIFLIAGIICSVESFECFSFASKRMTHKAGIRGIIIGAILLSLGTALSSIPTPQIVMIENIGDQIVTGSAILILIGGIINYICKEHS